MDLRIYRTLWGVPGSARHCVEALDRSCFDGIEAAMPTTAEERTDLIEALGARNVGINLVARIDGDRPAEQIDRFRDCLEAAAPFDPDRVVVQASCDYWPPQTTIEFYRRIVEIEREYELQVAHETHRRRAFGNPWTTVTVLREVPEVRLCCDFSHWVVVCESLLTEHSEALELASARAIHLHARVGTEQAPQVADPSNSCSSRHLAEFESWWREIWISQAEAGADISTLTPEYGPPPYQVPGGSSEDRAAALASACEWQAARERGLFTELGFASKSLTRSSDDRNEA